MIRHLIGDLPSGIVHIRSVTQLMGALYASATDMESATDGTKIVPPNLVSRNPGVPKCWAYVTYSGGVPTLQANFNITSITDTGVGDLTITIATDFSSANWSALGTCGRNSSSTPLIIQYEDTSPVQAGSVEFRFRLRDTGNPDDPMNVSFAGMGDQ